MKIYVQVTDDNKQVFEGYMELKKLNKKNTKTPKKTKTTVSGPTDIVNQLYFQNYFESNRTLGNVESKIKSKKYNFDSPAIVLALSRSKFLKRQGKRGKYSYIQKTPPN